MNPRFPFVLRSKGGKFRLWYCTPEVWTNGKYPSDRAKNVDGKYIVFLGRAPDRSDLLIYTSPSFVVATANRICIVPNLSLKVLLSEYDIEEVG